MDDFNAVTKAFHEGVTAHQSFTTLQDSQSMPGYTLIRELGRGGMGVVYLASQIGLNRSVALKMVLNGEHASELEKSRFFTEAEAVASIRHPFVVQVFDFGTQDGRPFFALEYLSGGSLAQRLSGTPLPPEETTNILIKLAQGVQAAHDSQIIHRDLKPANVLFDDSGEPRITDFGLARRRENESGMTQTGAVLGTPSYMSPEQADGRKDIGPEADIYSLGAILYECLTGRPPFRAASIIETIHQVKDQEPLAPTKFNPSIPRDLETICLKCLSKSPLKRYASAKALADDLSRFERKEPIHARPVSYFERARHWLRRNPMAGVISGLILGGIGLLIGLQARANARLQTERDHARQSEKSATEQRTLAQARLRKAVEAVDKMLVRVASERWATRPELQIERRQVLEDAVDFYAGLTVEDSKDVVVRKESAVAYTRLAGTYLLANELSKAEMTVEKAIRLYEGLREQSPLDASFPGSLSELLTMRGNIAAIRAQFEDAIRDYNEAVSLARIAVELAPSEVVYKLRQFQAIDGQCYFYMISNPQKGRELHKQSESLLRAMLADGQPSYEVQLAEVEWENLSAAFFLRDNKFKEAETSYLGNLSRLALLKQLPSPSARVSERVALATSTAHIRLGISQMIMSREPKILQQAIDHINTGLEICNSLLSIQPMAFPFQAQKITALGSLAVANRRLKRADASQTNLNELTKLESMMIENNSSLFWIRTISRTNRVFELIERARQGDVVNILVDVDQLLSDDQRVGIPPELIYNCACTLSIACRSIKQPDQKAILLKRALNLLQLADSSGYFKIAENKEMLAKDPDLDQLRSFEAFLQFKPSLHP